VKKPAPECSSLGEARDVVVGPDQVLEVGLDFEVGVGGARLSQAQRQKLGLARALVKRPDMLVVNDATAALRAKVAALALKAFNREIQRELGIANTFTTMAEASIKAAEGVFQHPGVALLCVTGGPVHAGAERPLVQRAACRML
jgi:ABC-type taurine transport system ATPase subunit